MSTTSEAPRRTRTIRVKQLARVEGEGALRVRIRGGRVTDVRLEIFEPPRFFEAFLARRRFTEAPDITARICGICPIAYQLGASQAMEQACGVEVGGALRDLRHLVYCGEWIESHALHLFMLHAPDFLGYQDVIRMAKDHPEIVEKGLRLKKAGNAIMTALGGREIHPINLRVGGFYRTPTRAELEPLARELAWAREAALETVEFAAGLPFPDLEQDYTLVALHRDDEYAILDGRLVSNRGHAFDMRDFERYVSEEHVEHSTALRASLRDHGPYLVGPLARFALNFEQLRPVAREAAEQAGVGPDCRNPFKSILVRAVEIVHACDLALELIEGYRRPAEPAVEVVPRAGTGFGCTEAPRGICWHRYTIDDAGLIERARIVPPTSQNQKAIEADLQRFVSEHLDLPPDELQWQCEQCVRNYDPCISCSCHFLKLHVDRA